MKATGSDYQARGGEVTTARSAPSKKAGLKDLLNSDYVKQRFNEVMGDKAPAFLASVLNAMRTNPSLADCDPYSVVSSAMAAAALDLPIDSSLGFAAIVPYKSKGRMVAQFQIMTKGFVQLALRSGQYKTINVSPIYEDEMKGYDIITGDVFIEPVEDGFRAHDVQEKIVGYAAFFRLLNGFERIEYWSLKKIIAHGKRFSKSFDRDYGLWKTDPHAMYQKTVLKNMLSRWGILSTSMQMAMKADQAAISSFDKPVDESNVEYVDSTTSGEPEEEAQGEPAASLPASQGAEPAPAAAVPARKAEPVPTRQKPAEPPVESYSAPGEEDFQDELDIM